MNYQIETASEETLWKDTRTKNKIFVFSKKVKEYGISYREIDSVEVIKKILEIIDKLPEGDQKKLDELSLDTNPRNWVKNLLENSSQPHKEKMEELINDFTDCMKTRMREEEKYAVGLLYKNKLLLAHSEFGEETITPDWKVVKRLLDSHNVIRYVLFIRESNGDITVKYYEVCETDFFVEWLGQSVKDSIYYFGGKYRITTESSDGIIITLELPLDKVENWIGQHKEEIKNSKIEFQTPIRELKITQIRVGRKKYNNPRDFLYDFYSEMYNVEYYRKKFKEINSLERYMCECKYLDTKTQVVKIEGDNRSSFVTKTNTNFDILFTCDLVEIDENYLEDLCQRFRTEEPIKIYHAGHPVSTTPFKIKSMEIWNEVITSALFKNIYTYYRKGKSNVDYTISQLLEIILFYLLEIDNKKNHLSGFFNSFWKKLLENIKVGDRIIKLEDELFEFKARNYLDGKDEDIITKLSGDIKNKLKTNRIKIYIIGANDDGSLDPIPNARLKSDRLNRIIEKIKNEARVDILYPLWVSCENNESIVILIVGRNNGSEK